MIGGRVLLAEDLGATNLLHVNMGNAARPHAGEVGATTVLGSADLLAIVDGEVRVEANRPIQLSVPESRVHFFDPETGVAL